MNILTDVCMVCCHVICASDTVNICCTFCSNLVVVHLQSYILVTTVMKNEILQKMCHFSFDIDLDINLLHGACVIAEFIAKNLGHKTSLLLSLSIV